MFELNAEAAGFSSTRLDSITDHINRNYMEAGKIAGCQVLVTRHGYPAYFQNFGAMDLERSRAMQDDTIFRIYSMTKPITSVALMQLYEQGHFQLNDPIYRLIPEWRDQQVWVEGEGEAMQTRPPLRPVSFRHVLSHGAGLTYGASAHPVDKVYRQLGLTDRRNGDLATFLKDMGRVPLRFDPGERWMYSFATDVCGGLVEAISGQPLDVYLKEHIFDPLQMNDTAFYVAPEKATRLAANYSRNKDKSLRLIDDPANSMYLSNPKFFSGGGGLTGTVADYYRFCEMLRQGGSLDGQRILGPRTLDLMRINHLKAGQDLTRMAVGSFSETAYEGVGFGLGFAMTLDRVASGGMSVGDFYWGGAASTIFWVDPVEDLSVVFMTQLMPSATFNFRGQIKNIVYSAIE